MKLEELRDLLDEVRLHWPDTWRGTQIYVEQCLGILGHSAVVENDPEITAIYRCMCELAELIERHGHELAENGGEPPYHNRLHTVDTLFSLTALLVGQRRGWTQKTAAWRRREWIAMLAMLGHDYLHDGTVNVSPAQIERRSIENLMPLMTRCQVSADDMALVKTLIFNTDPKRVRECHLKMRGRPFRIEDTDCLIVLVQEADIMASALPWTGQELTLRLAREWAKIMPDRARALLTPQGRVAFLRDSALFTSPASNTLGLNQIKREQIAEIECLDSFN
jgi:hypothetical protein